jgi:hypothetical protein
VALLADLGPALFLHTLVQGGPAKLRGLADRIMEQFVVRVALAPTS